MALWHSLESGSETSRLISVVATGSGEPREMLSLALASSRLQLFDWRGTHAVSIRKAEDFKRWRGDHFASQQRVGR